ncbi:2-succinyl-5-enolpyruvyl-6-hydroxy-3-cyclohexene-1-carboxylic-acid synthase [Motilimonas cestriensis]|uniref:2-succinyl-5-enolpyruvyl-6-hydroxy-3-cyclohexene-1-carboxylate synthase n=1 Tax=Motilimonas cestriensis TaxID=2742685 RepID=A0ABS8W6U5_9GAMM|nr:2-succinyl-5-enolpyruvyl-6-hydroxy-3-cyclohexene-1-carboxylic-acid synthase [Motilimonas cestriensis]MCE2594092.1 2-succinyl-5-enolpyruvyl-6-hydroxy-3-cyclohexene-1-carboxylic-acid synthase [Motilimonas cestriensis]
MKQTTASNISLLWAQLIIESLYRGGINQIFMAPGSRSTPLTLAAHGHHGITLHSHFDERGLGYCALGAAKAQQAPVAIITTSGTAVANLHPAIIEAKLTGVPLIILSADRPTELLQCSANQAIDQVGMFTSHVVTSLNLATASTEISASYLLAQVGQALYLQQQRMGPIHINCPFREPFYPKEKSQDLRHYIASINDWLRSELPYINKSIHPCRPQPIVNWSELQTKKGLIVVGQLANTEQAYEVASFAQALGWPLLMDIQSSGKGHPWSLHYYDQLLHHPDFTAALNQTELVIQFGSRLVSKRLQQFLQASSAQFIGVQSQADLMDPNHAMGNYFQIDAMTWLNAHPVAQHNPWAEHLYRADAEISQLMAAQSHELSELSVTHCLSRLVPDNSALFIGNSLPVRLMDMFAEANSKQQQVFTNRGASGIDGLLASAIGVSKILTHRPVTLLIGDTSLLHDLNSMALLKQLENPFVLIVLNNDGGSIFNLLPLPDDQQTARDCYQLPHGLNFAEAAAMFGINYMHPTQQQEFELDYASALIEPGATLIEIKVPAKESSEMINTIAEQVKQLDFAYLTQPDTSA